GVRNEFVTANTLLPSCGRLAELQIAVCFRGVEGGAGGRNDRRPEGATKPCSHQDRQVRRARAFPGGEEAAKDSLREDHEADLEEGCHGDDWRPRRCVNSRRPLGRQGDHPSPRAVQEAAPSEQRREEMKQERLSVQVLDPPGSLQRF
ncbi:hypothetical protein LDENG_00222450, partial [Lucifuga dentata]